MRKVFFALFLFLAIAFVVQVRWGNGAGVLGIPLIAGSLAAAGAVLDWDEILFLSLLAAYIMGSRPGVSVEQVALGAIAFAAWAFLRAGTGYGLFGKTALRRETAAALAAIAGVFTFAMFSRVPSGTTLLYAVVLAFWIGVGAAWSFFGVRLARVFE